MIENFRDLISLNPKVYLFGTFLVFLFLFYYLFNSKPTVQILEYFLNKMSGVAFLATVPQPPL